MSSVAFGDGDQQETLPGSEQRQHRAPWGCMWDHRAFLLLRKMAPACESACRVLALCGAGCQP